MLGVAGETEPKVAPGLGGFVPRLSSWRIVPDLLPSPYQACGSCEIPVPCAFSFKAGLSLRHRRDLDRILSRLPGDNRYVMDYFVVEVLSQQPTSIQEYLLTTSVLNRFCSTLCDAVSGTAFGTVA